MPRIITLLGAIGLGSTLALRQTLDHPDSQVRWSATHALRKIDRLESPVMLEDIIDHPNFLYLRY